MEDILASIRRILAEDGAPADADLDDGKRPVPAAEPRAPMDQEMQGASPPSSISAASLAEDLFDAPQPARPSADDADAEADEEDVFMLLPEMRVEQTPEPRTVDQKLVSEQVAVDSTDVLSQLARAILDRRDIQVSSRDVTLESMVREMLRPLLREWLDRNLPYLIERLVKKEIDLMINRAERLED